jgi:hypothetical protein
MRQTVGRAIRSIPSARTNAIQPTRGGAAPDAVASDGSDDADAGRDIFGDAGLGRTQDEERRAGPERPREDDRLGTKTPT